jgi:hypothetical protein
MPRDGAVIFGDLIGKLKCGARMGEEIRPLGAPCHRTAATKFEDDISVARMILVGPLPRPSGPGLQDPLRPGPLCTLNPEQFRLE